MSSDNWGNGTGLRMFMEHGFDFAFDPPPASRAIGSRSSIGHVLSLSEQSPIFSTLESISQHIAEASSPEHTARGWMKVFTNGYTMMRCEGIGVLRRNSQEEAFERLCYTNPNTLFSDKGLDFALSSMRSCASGDPLTAYNLLLVAVSSNTGSQFVQGLLEAKANPNFARDRGDDCQTTPLDIALARADLKSATVLLKHGADPLACCGRSPYAALCIVAKFASDVDARHALAPIREPQAKDKFDAKNVFVDSITEPFAFLPPEYGHPGLHWIALAQTLLSKGCDPGRRRDKPYNPSSIHDASPLMVSLFHGHAAMTRTLLAHGADIYTTFGIPGGILRPVLFSASKGAVQALPSHMDLHVRDTRGEGILASVDADMVHTIIEFHGHFPSFTMDAVHRESWRDVIMRIANSDAVLVAEACARGGVWLPDINIDSRSIHSAWVTRAFARCGLQIIPPPSWDDWLSASVASLYNLTTERNMGDLGDCIVEMLSIGIIPDEGNLSVPVGGQCKVVRTDFIHTIKDAFERYILAVRREISKVRSAAGRVLDGDTIVELLFGSPFTSVHARHTCGWIPVISAVASAIKRPIYCNDDDWEVQSQ